jgi:hypothetical protein
VADQPPRLAKAIWSEVDFETMGWHDAIIYAMALLPSGEFLSRLVLDLDYIVEWVDPPRGERTFRFWIAPATLVFDQAWELRGQLRTVDGDQVFEIQNLHREPVRDGHGGYRWHLEGESFDLSLRAPGYRQTFRRHPVFTEEQRLTLERRGGVVLEEIPYT